jgi:hypothetical protein
MGLGRAEAILMKKIELWVRWQIAVFMDRFDDTCWADLVLWAMFPENYDFVEILDVRGTAGQCEKMGSEPYCGANGMVADADLMTSFNQAMLLVGESMADQFPALLEIAQASAAATGQAVGFMLDSLVTGKSAHGIDNADYEFRNQDLTFPAGPVQ